MSERRLVVETDGGSRGNPGPAAYGALVRDPTTGAVLAERAGDLGVVSNTVAEYTGLIEGLRAAVEIDPGARIDVRADSKLVVEQMSGRWQVKNEDMRRLAAQARVVRPPGQVTYTWVPRSANAAADALANEAMDTRQTIARDLVATAPGSAARMGTPPGSIPPRAASTLAGLAPRPSGAPSRFDDAAPVTVVLVRHGETPLTVSRAYSGSSVPGPGLTGAGQAEAAAAAAVVVRIGHDLWPDLAVPTVLIASPMVRTQETARVLGERLGLVAGTDARFAECDFGRWEGLTRAEIEAQDGSMLRTWHLDPTVRTPGGESVADVDARVRAVLDDLTRTHLGATVVVATHTVVVRAAVGMTLGAGLLGSMQVRVPPGSITIIRRWPDDAELVVSGYPVI